MKIIVVGAGLAGAATAYALAERGCNVTVLEASAPSSASTAPSSGLPVALMAPHHSADDNAISQLSRLGVAATTHAAQNLLQEGHDWQTCGALQRAGKLGPLARWYPEAAWVKPAALVAAWLAHPRITLHMGMQVQRLRCLQGASVTWQALDAHSSVLAEADAVVLANAYRAQALLQGLPDGMPPAAVAAAPAGKTPALPLHQVAGQVVYGPWNSAWQALWPSLLPELADYSHTSTSAHTPCSINGNGHFIPAIAWQGGHIWLSGSTYEHEVPTPGITAQGLVSNVQRLQQLIPAAAQLLATQHSAGLLQGWAGARCTTRDRLPAVGAVSLANAPGLYLCTAMGSRGLSFAALCAQHASACIVGAADSPLPAHLQLAINPARLW
jgi:tRNA 5-methylaminomethyl-2-thiouridine biosynthesis bifunctional protein